MGVYEISKGDNVLVDSPPESWEDSSVIHPDLLAALENDNPTQAISKKERKRMLAREHNRAYQAGELNRPVDLKDIVRGVVQHAAKSLDIRCNK